MELLRPAAVTVFVHAIDTAAHPGTPPGYWRWAIHIGQTPADLAECVNAGGEPTAQEAHLAGEMVGVAVAKALELVGHPVRYRVVELPHDPIPSGQDRISIGR